MKWVSKRFVAIILILCMLFSMVPSNVFAQNPVLYGDVNKSGTVNQDDVNDLEKYLTEYDIDIDLAAADVNADEVLDLRDVLLLKQHVAGLPVVLGQAITVTFHTDGSAVEPIKLCKGATLASVVDKMPVTQKDGYVFAGWKVENGSPFYAEDAVETNIDVYAYFEKIESQETISISSFSLEDQKPDLSFTICSDSERSVEGVRNALSLLPMDGSDPVELDVIKVTDTEFTVKASEGFNEGASYQLILDDGFDFKGKESSIRTANFTIHREEVDNLSYKDDIIYIKDSDKINYILNGASAPVQVLETALLSNKDSNEAVTGYFNYSDGSLSEGSILCIYENIHPLERDYTSDDYSDDASAYVEVTKVEGTKISFKSINEEDADKVIFLPDTIPFSVETLPTGDSGTISAEAYDSTAWEQMEYTGVPQFDAGDFLVFYMGAFSDITEDSDVYFGKVTAVNGSTVTYKKTTAEEMKKSQDMFIENPVSGDELLENMDKEVLEEQIEQQALKSGFAAEAANYLASAAQETDGFKNMKLKSFSAKTASGQTLSAAQLKNVGGSWKLSDNVKVTATVGKSSKYFKDGLSLSLRIDGEFSVDLGEDGEMKIDLSATFVEEIAVSTDISAKAKIKWIIIVPIFKSLRFGASVDIKNYSAISIDVKVYTVEKEDEGFWEKLKGYDKKLGGYLEKAEELKEKIDEAKETADKIKGYEEDLEKLWRTIRDISKTMPEGELTQESYESLLDTLGQLNVTEEMKELLSLTTDEEREAGVKNLMERYSQMLENESDWITLVQKEIFSKDIHISIFAINIEMNFVVKANVNIALGANLEYVVGKRYSFWIDIIKKTSGSSTMDLLDERFAFQFYVMGALGIRMGVEAGIKAGIISTKLGSIGVTAEFGPYVKLWGYFIYEYSKMRPAGTNAWNYDERMMGALYLEFGLYLEVAFEAQVLDGLISYNPTLLDKEFPLVTAGNRKNYYGFAYELDDDEVLIVEDVDKNSNNGISMTLPESYRLMNYIDLVEGDLEQEVGVYSRFTATLSNRNFHLDTNTGLITVDVPNGVQYMECDLTLTWKMGKMEFSKRDISVTIPLVWTNLSTEELNQKFTATVKVGNNQDGYTTVWSGRVKKNTAFNLPTHEEILDIIGYNSYNRGNENLKYENVLGYGIQQTTDLAIYTDTTYYFNVIPREYTLTVNGVQNADGTTGSKQFKAKYGESFDLTELLSSGARKAAAGNYTSYLKTEATLKGSTVTGIGKDAKEINQNVTRVIDSIFATDILYSVDYTAKYTDNSVKATFNFVGKDLDMAEKTVKIEKGTIPPDIFTNELAQNDFIVKSITPALCNITTDTTFTVNCEINTAPGFLLTYHTNGGTSIPQREVKQGSMLIAPTEPTRTGYSFGGWYTDAEMKDPFDFTNAVMPGNALDLYAKWVGKTFEVSFDANEGMLPEGTKDPITVTYEKAYGNLPTPVRTGYKFLGWYTERTGGLKLSATDTVAILKNTKLFAHWQEKQTINSGIITYTAGQQNTYNRKNQPFKFSTGSLSSDSFEVYYKRQSLDSSYSSEAINAGTYDIKLVHQEDENYKYFETLLVGVYIIEKADSSILTIPSAAQVYYGNIAPTKMVSDVDYIGDGKLQYAVCNEEPYLVGLSIRYMPRTPAESDWVSGEVLYNINDKKDYGTSLYLWVRLAEGENYKASETRMSAEKIQIKDKPKTLLSSTFSGNETLTYELWIKTSDIKKAGTDSKIYIKIGDGEYQHLDNEGNDFEQGDLDKYKLTINAASLYNTCYGTIPITLKYEKKGTSAGWHCEYVKLNVYKNGVLVVDGAKYGVNHWFGTEDHDESLIEETYELTGYEREISSWNGEFLSDSLSSLELESTSADFSWSWMNPTINDAKRGISYDPYRFLNAPELAVSFNNKKYNRYITQCIKSFKLDRKSLYQAMVADGISELTLTYTLEFKPVNSNRSVTKATSVRTKTIKVSCNDASEKSLNSNTALMLSKSAKAMFSLNSKQLTSVNSEVIPGQNGTFDVAYRLDENAGIWGAKFSVNYDNTKVQLTGYTLGDIFTEDEVMHHDSYADGRYVFFARRNTFDDTNETGKLVTLHFKIKAGASLSEYPVYMDTSASQSINAESGIVSLAVNSNAPKIRVSGNISDIRNQDTVTAAAYAGSSDIKNIQVNKDDGDFTDITETYKQGYTINENGTYTFRLITTDGEEATTSITYTLIDTVKPVVVIDAGSYEENKWTTGSITITPRNTANNLGTTTFSYRIGENGEWNSYSEPISVNVINGGVDTTYYFKVIGESGAQSDVVEYKVKLDNIIPVISGVTDGKIYCTAVTVTVTDDNLDTVKLDGEAVILTEGRFTVYAADKAQTITATDKAGNEKSISITVNSDHTWDEGVVTLPATVSEKGVRTHTCTNCGEIKTEEIDRTSPEMIEGENGQWTQGGSETLMFRSNASISDFINVLVDGKVISSENYDLREGSIIVTLKADYLETLSAGTHTVGIQSISGIASAEFTIAAKADDKDPVKPGDVKSPKSGDNSSTLWIALLFVTGSMLAAFGVKRKKQ